MATDSRNRAARARAEEVLAYFGMLAADHLDEFVVIGGLNPDFLAPGAPVPHTGTTDVDLLFELGFIYDRDEHDFAWLDGVVDDGRFHAQGSEGWRWSAELGEAFIRLDLLCDVHDHPGQVIALPGARKVAAMNFAGPAPALIVPVTREIAIPEGLRGSEPDTPTHIALRFANLGGYLIAKSVAARSRRLPKDLYDLMFVTLYNPDGPRGAAQAVREQLAMLKDEVGSRVSIVEAMQSFTNHSGSAAAVFAREMLATGDENSAAQLQQDAAYAARRFLETLRS